MRPPKSSENGVNAAPAAVKNPAVARGHHRDRGKRLENE